MPLYLKSTGHGSDSGSLHVSFGPGQALKPKFHFTCQVTSWQDTLSSPCVLAQEKVVLVVTCMSRVHVTTCTAGSIRRNACSISAAAALTRWRHRQQTTTVQKF